MEVGWIERENLAVFRSLLLPEMAEAVDGGQPVTVLGLMEGDIACGAAAALLRGGTLDVRSLYVAPDYRRRGGGRLLMDALLEIAVGQGETANVSYTSTRPDHETLPPFLTALGFVQQDAPENLYCLTVDELAQSRFFEGVTSAPRGATCFAELPRGALSATYRAALVKGGAYLPFPLTDPRVDARVSVAVMERNEIRSFAAFTAPEPGRIDLAWVQSGRPQDMPLLLHAAYLRVRKHYPPETVMTVQAISPAAAALVTALLPHARPISHTYVRAIP